MIDINRIGIEIKKLRESMNISQAQFAELIDRSTATVGQYERSERYPSYKTLDIIFKKFGVDANPFFSREKTQYSMEAILMLNLFSHMKKDEKKTLIDFHKLTLPFLDFTETNQIVNSEENKLGIVIKKLRENMSISQAKLAQLIGKSTSTVGQFERGEAFPNCETLCKIIDFFDMDANLFFPRANSQYSMESTLILLTLDLFSNKMKEDEQKTIINFYQNLSRLLNFIEANQIVNREEE